MRTSEVAIACGGAVLGGTLTVPAATRGTIVFAHGSGSGRHSPRNRAVAAALNDLNLSTLLFDLLTEEEERLDAATGHLRFDIEFLARRLEAATEWVSTVPELEARPLGYFGASTGGAAALVAAAHLTTVAAAVVSRGGRPDLAGEECLQQVKVPTLLIVGGRDVEVLELNEQAFAQLRCPKRLDVVPGASHLFEEVGALDEVIRLSSAWFTEHLATTI